MRRLVVSWLMSVIAIVLAMSAASAHAAPSDPRAFTHYVADRLHRSVPEAGVAVKADLALEASGVDGARLVVSLARLYDFCARRRASCDDAVEYFLASAAERVRETAKRREPRDKPPSSHPGHAT